MSELRKDPITGRWVIISSERGKKPSSFVTPKEEKTGGFCPFCSGNENKTPPEIFAKRKEGTSSNQGGWTLRIVANKFPALKIEGDLNRRGEGIFDKMNGIGAHEVIIETPNHGLTMADLSNEEIEDIIRAYKFRIEDLKKDPRFKYVMIFKNHGSAAGASLEHTHSQLIALPIIPKRVKEELDNTKIYFKFKDRCIFCDIIRQEIEQKIRVICERDRFLVISPFAPRFPFETWILPKVHGAKFEDLDKDSIVEFAHILKDTLVRMNKVLNDPPYNFIIHSKPFNIEGEEYYHWHLELMPKLTKVAGFEWGTGFYINPTPPEDAARFLRESFNQT
ncbi:MAG: galactose-1-phosphate uridylyltransferase [bacterium]